MLRGKKTRATNFTLGKRVSSPQRIGAKSRPGEFEPKTHVVLMQDMQKGGELGAAKGFLFFEEVKLTGRSHVGEELTRIWVPLEVHERRLPFSEAALEHGKTLAGRMEQVELGSFCVDRRHWRKTGKPKKIEICSFRTLELLQEALQKYPEQSFAQKFSL